MARLYEYQGKQLLKGEEGQVYNLGIERIQEITVHRSTGFTPISHKPDCERAEMKCKQYRPDPIPRLSA